MNTLTNASTYFDHLVSHLYQRLSYVSDLSNAEYPRAIRLFSEMRKTQGISLSNFLPWEAKFIKGPGNTINGITLDDLEKPVMWGIDSLGRPFVAFKYTCNAASRCVATFFKTGTTSGRIDSAFMDQSNDCATEALIPYVFKGLEDNFFANITSLFEKKEVASVLYNRSICHLSLIN